MASPLVTTTSESYAPGETRLTSVGSAFGTVAELMPYAQPWIQRCTLYAVRRSYYRGTLYQDRPDLVRALKLYSGIRQIFGPLRRAVRIDVAKVPGEWAFDPGCPEENEPGVPNDVRMAVEQVRAWSSARASYSRATMHGAIAGEFGLLMVDDRYAKQVRIVPLRPDEVVTGVLSTGLPFGLVIKSNLVDRQGVYEYAMLITNNTITTYRSGILHDYDGNGAERANLLGFVPLLLSPYLAGEDGYGECAFSGAQELLDRVNEAASLVLDVIERNAEPLTVFSGVQSVDFNSSSNAVTMPPADAKAYTLVPNLVIAEALEMITAIKTEFKQQLPQLILDSLVSRNDLAYDTVLTLLSELTDHIRDVRTHVDTAIETAERWALLAGNTMGLWTVDPALHRLDSERPVIAMTPNQQLDLQLKAQGLRPDPTPPSGMLDTPQANTETGAQAAPEGA